MQVGGAPSDETKPLDEHKAIGVYKRSKVAAERLVEKMVAEHGLPAVIVNPSTPIGPRDVKPTPTGRIVVEAARGRMPGFVDTGLNLVHVDDVADGHLAALARGKIGERYILGGQDVRLSDMLAEIAGMTGRRPPRLRVPRRADLPAGIRRRNHRPLHRPRTVRHHGRAAHGQVPHVLQPREGRARTRHQGPPAHGRAPGRDRLVS